ncbi:hypothetical protein Dimus_016563 [Dionaea muscipula]
MTKLHSDDRSLEEIRENRRGIPSPSPNEKLFIPDDEAQRRPKIEISISISERLALHPRRHLQQRPKDQPPSRMAQIGDLNDQFSIIRELEHRLLFFDRRRIISIDDYRIRLNLESKLGVHSNYLDLEQLRTFWNICRSTPDFPYDVQVAVADMRERFESLSLRDFMCHCG